MKTILSLALFLAISHYSSAQFGVSFHQSNLPFVGFNYQLGEKWLPELRVGVDNFLSETSLELAVNYIVKETDDVQVYTGLGGRVQSFDGLVIPVGLNIYPFEQKKLGCHIEMAGLVAYDDVAIRGSWGIRYRFLE
ncbi:MAG: hypothetical protein RIF33_18510 [Cyclobacteriaceae bacterium]